MNVVRATIAAEALARSAFFGALVLAERRAAFSRPSVRVARSL